jgi:uncharacterized protein YqhQ
MAASAGATEITPPSGNGAGPQPRLRLGGMALRNGLLIHGPNVWAAAVRKPDGAIAVASGKKPTLAGPGARIPLLRGPLRLLEALAVVPIARRALPAARLPFEDARVATVAVLTAISSGAIRRQRPTTPLREGIATLLGVAPALFALRDSDLAAYHGVEHKAIAAYEQGNPDPASVAKEHERCGSILVAPLLVLSIAGQLLVERMLEQPGQLARGAAGLAGVSIAVEMFAWAERNPSSPLAHAFRRPGIEIQRLIATREPTSEQLEVGVAALAEVLRMETLSG